MAIPTITDDGGEDLLPTPTPGVPNQDALGKLPAEIDQPPSQEEVMDEQGLAAEAVRIGGELKGANEKEESPDPEIMEVQETPPEPFDATITPELFKANLADEAVNVVGAVESDLAESVPESPSLRPDVPETLLDFMKGMPAGADPLSFGGPPGGGGEDLRGAMPPGADDYGGTPPDTGIQGALDADFRSRDSTTNFLIDHTRKIEELTERLERCRL